MRWPLVTRSRFDRLDSLCERAEEAAALYRLERDQCRALRADERARSKDLERERDRLEVELEGVSSLIHQVSSWGVEREGVGDTYDVRVIVQRPVWDNLPNAVRRLVIEQLASEIASKIADGFKSAYRTLDMATRETP